MHFLGMAGHFGLGNTNSLASIDVAGAFIVSFNQECLKTPFLHFLLTWLMNCDRAFQVTPQFWYTDVYDNICITSDVIPWVGPSCIGERY